MELASVSRRGGLDSGRGRIGAVAGSLAAAGPAPWLLALLLLCSAYAAFGDGAIDIPAEGRFQVGVALVGLLCGLALASGGLRLARLPLVWGAIAMLAGFALWSAVSIVWSSAPDASWLASNRGATYVVIAVVTVVVASNIRDAPSLVGAGLTAVIAAVALYALGGKLFPGLDIAGFSLDPGNRFARLRDPIGYWNALGLLCVMGAPLCIWLAASRAPARGVRIVALLVLAILVFTAALSYSRGATIAYLAVLVVLVGAGPRRLSRLVVGIGAVVAMVPCIVIAFGRHDLSTGGVSLGERADDGALLALALLLTLLALAGLARRLIGQEQNLVWTDREARRAWRRIAGGAAALLLVGAIALSVLGRGLPGEISHQFEQFKEQESAPGNSPERLISANGSSRWVWWQESLGAFSDKPLAGWGAGSYPVFRHLYRREQAPVLSAHSVPLQFLSETGLIGALLGLGGLALLGVAAVRQLRRSRGSERSARLALCATAAAWAVHSLYDWDWEIPAVTVPALIAVCVAATPLPRALGRRPRTRFLGAAAFASAAAVGAAVLAISAALPSLSEGERLDALAIAGNGGSLEQAAAKAELSHRLNPLAVEPLFAASGIANRRGRFQEATGLVEEATRIQPDNWEGWRRLSVLEAGLRDREAAASAFLHWAETDPFIFNGLEPTVAAYLFQLEVPPRRSPTAFGTPSNSSEGP